MKNADMEECTDFNLYMRVTVFAECIYVLTKYLKYLSIWRHSYFLQWNVGGSEKSRFLYGSIWWLCVPQLFE